MRRLEWSIAWRYLRSRRESRLLSFISMIAIGGVVVGVSALIVTIGVMNGLQTDLREKILIGSPDIRVLNYGDNLRLRDWNATLASVRAQPGVVAAAPFVLTEAIVANAHGFSAGFHVEGILADGPNVPVVTSIRKHAIDGDFRFATGDGRHRGIAIGDVAASNMQLQIGDTVAVIAGGGARDARALAYAALRPEVFIVTGIFSTGMYEYDNAYVFVDLAAAQPLAGLGADVTGIEVKTVDRWKAPKIAAELDSALGFPFRSLDWTAQNASLFSALRLEKFAMSVILLLIIIVAAFNIVSTLTMVVRDKTREIGILRAMGLRARSVRNVFVVQGFVIGAAGTLAGLTLGVAAGRALDRYRLIPLDPKVYFIDHLPVAMQAYDTTLIVLASVVIATLATWYPARQAARLFPVEAIRHE